MTSPISSIQAYIETWIACGFTHKQGLEITYEYIEPAEGEYVLDRAFDILFEETLKWWKQGKN